MRVTKSKARKVEEADLTPMIDMTFQLIAFFMILINFSKVEKTEEIMLPNSQLAKSPDEPPEHRILLNLKPEGEVLFAGRAIRIPNLKSYVDREIENAVRKKVSAEEIQVIIRAHRATPMKTVQELISKCQESELETFTLRVESRT